MMILDCGPLWVCTDCALLIGNDDESGAPAGHRARFADWQATYGDDGHLVVADDVDEFSRTRCDGCGDTDAGTRHAAVCLVTSC